MWIFSLLIWLIFRDFFFFFDESFWKIKLSFYLFIFTYKKRIELFSKNFYWKKTSKNNSYFQWSFPFFFDKNGVFHWSKTVFLCPVFFYASKQRKRGKIYSHKVFHWNKWSDDHLAIWISWSKVLTSHKTRKPSSHKVYKEYPSVSLRNLP